MTCIILAAGYATRLYPLTKNFPKPLLKVAGKPILNHLIEDTSALINEYIVVSNHKFAHFFEDWATKLPYNIVILDDGTASNKNRLGAVKDIQFAIHQLGLNDDCLVIAGDNLLDFSLREFLDFAREKQASCVMYYEEPSHEKLTKTGVLELADDHIINMEEKPKHPKTHFVCPPFYYYTKADLARIDEALADGCGYDSPGSFLVWLCHKTTIHAYKMPGHRFDIGDHDSYIATKRYFEGDNSTAT